MSNTPPNVLFIVPIMSRPKFCHDSGVREGQLRGQASRDNVPVYNVGKLKPVNLVAANQLNVFHEFGCVWRAQPIVPIMRPGKFAFETGYTEEQVITQLDLGNLPKASMGRLIFVDVAALFHLCERECRPELVAS